MARRSGCLLAVGLAVLGVLVFYPAAAWIFLSTAVGRETINRKPERLFVEWDRAWSWKPGLVHVRGLRIRGQNRVIQWQLELDTATLPISLRGLAKRRFVVSGARGEGLAFRLRRRVDRLVDAERERWTPAIDGLENPPTAKPEELYPRRAGRVPWTIEIRDLGVGDVREVWLEEAKLTGSGDLEGGFGFEIGADFEMDLSRLSFAESQIETANGTVSEDLRLDVEARIEPFSPRGEGGPAVLRHLTGTLEAAGAVGSIEPLNALFRKAPWLHARATGTLDTRISLDRGTLLPGSHARVDASVLTLTFAGYRATGAGPFEAVVEDGDAPQLAATVDLSGVEVRRDDWDRPHAAGARLHLAASSRRLELGSEPFADLETRLDIAEARVDDLSIYNYYLPPAGGVEVLGGTGLLSGTLEASVEKGSAHGALVLRGEGLRIAAGDVRLEGRLELDTELPQAWLQEQRYDLSGTVLRLRDVTVREHDRERHGWWARLELEEAELAHREQVEVTARIRARLRDSGPIVALAAEKKRFVGLFDGFLTVENVDATSLLRSDGAGMELAALSVSGGERLEILGDLHLGGAGRSGLLFFRLGLLSAAVELDGEQRDWKLTRSRAWFEDRRVARSSGQPPDRIHRR